MLNGDSYLTREVGVNTTVSIRLPLAQDALSAQGQPMHQAIVATMAGRPLATVIATRPETKSCD